MTIIRDRPNEVIGPSTADRWIGTSLRRKEDTRLLRGQGRFVDDEERPRMLHVAVGRSPYPNARVVALRCDDAARTSGVASVLTGLQVQQRSNPLGVLRPLPGMPSLPFHAMASERVVFEGQPVVSIAATSRALAEDALEMVDIEYEPLPHVTTVASALEGDSPRVWPQLPSNLAARTTLRCGTPDGRGDAPWTVAAGTFSIGRIAGLPIETRVVFASWLAGRRCLTVVCSTQVPHLLRRQLAEAMAMPEASVRVSVGDVGGGFGVKLGIYPEDVLVCLHAMDTGRPVKWVEDRVEHFKATTQARESFHDASVAIDLRGEIAALRVDYSIDMGAYNSPFGPPMLTSLMYPGPYRLQDVAIERKIVFTNKPPVGAYRGYGQPESNFVREVLIDRAAHRAGVDPVECRMRSLLRPDELPYRSATGAVYDAGDYPNLLRRVLERMVPHVNGAASEHPDRSVGVGVAMFMEMTGYPGSAALAASNASFGAYESALLRANRDGGIDLYTAVSSFGQGTETSFAQVVADAVGVHLDDVTVHVGDTNTAPYNVGGFASRTTIAGTGAILRAAAVIREKALAIAAQMLDVPQDCLRLSDGRVETSGSASGLMFADVARAALAGHPLPPGWEPGLEAIAYFDPPASAFGSGAAAALVKVDADSGEYSVDVITLVHDCGRAINPQLVAGQILGGVTQGFGAATMEELIYDPESGQLTNGTLVDYLVPSASDVPTVDIVEENTPSPVTPLGVRGVGEAGTIPIGAAVANAICNALFPLRVEIGRLPITPESVWRAIEAARLEPPWPATRC